MYEVLVIGNPSFCGIPSSSDKGLQVNSAPSSYSLRTLYELGHKRLASVGAVAQHLRTQFRRFVDELGEVEYLALESDTIASFELEPTASGEMGVVNCVGATRRLRVRDVPDEYLSSDLVMLSPLLEEVDEEFIQWICDSSNARILMDPQLYRIGRGGRLELASGIDAFDKTQCYLDFVQVNRSEASFFSGEEDPFVQVELIVDSFAETCVLTLGSEGALIFDGQEFIRIPGVTVSPVDSYCAGAVHLGAFASGLLQGYSLTDAAALAGAAASLSVEQVGPMFHLDHQEMERRAGTILDRVQIT